MNKEKITIILNKITGIMKKTMMVLIPLVFVMVIVGTVFPANNTDGEKLAESHKINEEERLRETIQRLMKLVKTDISDMSQKVITDTIVRVTKERFETFEERRTFAIVLAIESKFRREAKSPVGATGIAQVMPQYAEEFAKKCNLLAFKKDDLVDSEINMTIGACQFKALMAEMNNNIAAVLVAYNAGPNSASLKQLKTLANMTNTEPSSYVAKYFYLREELDRLEQAAYAQLAEVK